MEVETEKFLGQFKDTEKLQRLFQKKLIELCFKKGVSINIIHDSIVLNGPETKVKEGLNTIIAKLKK